MSEDYPIKPASPVCVAQLKPTAEKTSYWCATCDAELSVYTNKFANSKQWLKEAEKIFKDHAHAVKRERDQKGVNGKA